MIRLFLVFLVIFVAVLASARSQGISAGERRAITARDSAIVLNHDFVIPATVRILLDSVHALTAAEFTLDARYGIITISDSLRSQLARDTSRLHTLSIAYNFRPLNLPREYYNRKLVTLPDSTGKVRAVAETRGALTATNIFGSNFHQTGGIVRGFTIGSNRDLSLQSRLWLQFSGKITDNVEVLGAVTDEDLPIQPEGNTQTLRDIDNIFIEFRSPYVGGTIGKFTTAVTNSEWTAYNRRLQGIKAVGRYDGHGTSEVVVAVSPGKFNTQQFRGIERVQGPYILTGAQGERNIIVVAGTERVYVDGIEMIRGENNDYVIDYGTAQIVFQTRRIITSASRISVDYEYSDQQYSRSFVSVANSANLLDSSVRFTANYVREADNPDATIDITLSESDRALLANAGGNQFRAVRSGAVLVGRNDTIQGYYIRRDTVIGGVADSVFIYAPQDPAANYSVSFSIPPDGRGDYQNVALGEYRFVGKGLGNYMPVTYLPFPQLRQIWSVGAAAELARGVNVSAEGAYSSNSLNMFSSDPSATRNGGALSATASARGDSVRIAGANLGAVRFDGTLRYLQAGFEPVQRLGDVQFSSEWNTSAQLGESATNDLLTEARLAWLPLRPLSISAYNGILQRGAFNSWRQQYAARLEGDAGRPALDYSFELIRTKDSLNPLPGQWLKQFGGASYTLGVFTPGVRIAYEDRQDNGSIYNADTIYSGSFRYLEAGPDLTVALPFMNASAQARFRQDDSVVTDAASGEKRLLHNHESQTYTLRADFRGVRDFSSTLDFTLRNNHYDSLPNTGAQPRLDNATILAREQMRWSGFDRGLDLDGLYEVQTQEAARTQRVFVRVPIGQGQYVWIDLDSNRRQSEDEFRPAFSTEGEYVRFDIPTNQLFPVINLRTSLRARLNPRNLFGEENGVGKFLAPVTSETYLRIEEQSQDQTESDIYLLRLSKFLNDSNTITGNQILQQDINVFANNPDYSFRLRYEARNGLTKLLETVERTQSIERSLRARWQPTFDIGLQLDLADRNSLLSSTDTNSPRAFNLNSLSAENDFSYRPIEELELGWTFHTSIAKDALPVVPRTIYQVSNRVRATYSLALRGTLRGEIERRTVTGENIGTDEYALPWQLTEGYGIGTNWLATVSFEYQFGSSIRATIAYNGRSDPPSNRIIHTGSAELRAAF